MRTWWLAGVLGWTLGTSAVVASTAGRGSDASPSAARSVAVMPAQYFSADATSAARLTDGLREEMRGRGWIVVAPEASASAAREIGLPARTNQPDHMALEFGHRLQADLVLYPRLLALGLGVSGPSAGRPDPAAVVLLRLLDVRASRSIYSRQVAHPLPPVASASEVTATGYILSADTARATARTALAGFQQRPAPAP